jgi:hypothetical protein
VLRDPVDRAFSAYKNLLRDNRESCSFEEALQLEDVRKQDNWEYLWYYRDVGFYHRQVEAYLRSFSQVRILLFDDFRDDPLRFMQEVFTFLQVDRGFIPSLQGRQNASGRLQNRFFRLVFRANGLAGSLYKFLSLNGFPYYKMLGIIEGIRHSSMQQLHMLPETRCRLRKLYRSDVRRLQRLIGKDLSPWFA